MQDRSKNKIDTPLIYIIIWGLNNDDAEVVL